MKAFHYIKAVFRTEDVDPIIRPNHAHVYIGQCLFRGLVNGFDSFSLPETPGHFRKEFGQPNGHHP